MSINLNYLNFKSVNMHSRLKKQYTLIIVVISISIVSITLFYTSPLFKELTDSVEVEVEVEVENSLNTTLPPFSNKTIITPNDLSQITQKLLAAGLNRQPVLD